MRIVKNFLKESATILATKKLPTLFQVEENSKYVGQYVPITASNVFCNLAPYAWAHKSYWFWKQDKSWDMLIPCLEVLNDKRKIFLKAVVLLFDESVAGWRPKTSKLGGLPNVPFEPHKTASLEMMFKNGIECISCILSFQDIVQGSER